MDIELGQAHLGVTLGVTIFDEFFSELFAIGVLPNTLTIERDTPLGGISVEIRLDTPTFEMVVPASGVPQTELHLTGEADVRPRPDPDPDADPIATPTIDLRVLLSFVLNPRTGDGPLLGLRYDGVAEPLTGAVSDEDVDEVFANSAIADAIGDVTMDIVGPAIDGLEPILFPSVPPDRSTWATALRLLPASSASEVDAVGVFIGNPGDDAMPPLAESPIPDLTGIALIYSRAFLDLAFAVGAAAQVGQTIQGAEITDLAMSMEDEAIHIDGTAEQDPAVITFEGSVLSQLIPGTIAMFQDTSGVDVDVDLPWWADVLLFFRFIPIFYPILIPVAAINEDWDVWAAASDVDAAPQQVRSGLAAALAGQMVALASGLNVGNAVDSVTLESTPDSSRIENGNMLFFAQTFVTPISEPVTNAFYSGRLERFVQYELESGRLFRASELARLVALGKIVTPGFHQVRRTFMRANPDNALGNNLEEMFGNNAASLPY